jgi:OOP family OmpA-OmpF porin
MNTTNIYFATNKADIEVASFETLDKIANVLLDCPDASIEVAGHTDSVGEDAFNLALSEKRAESVASYLRSQKSLKNEINAVGYGEKMPIADNSTASGQARNRRIQFIVK